MTAQHAQVLAGKALTPKAPAGQRFSHVARMEWIKLRTLRSTWFCLALTGAGAAAIAIAVGVSTRNAGGDLTNNALAGMVPGLMAAGVLGVLMITGEYTSGTIRSTLAAAPRRPVVLAAKAAVFGAVTLVLGELAAFGSFFAGGAALGHGIAAPTLGQPGVLRAVVLGGAGFCLVGLLGVGLGAIIRHTPAALAVLVGGVYILAQALGFLGHVAAFMPIIIVGNSLTTTKPELCAPHAGICPHPLSAWAGLGVLVLYAAVALVAGGWVLTRRDA
jgi:ABC-type transport system involved in multi-copper enzyme maturation permease subunit